MEDNFTDSVDPKIHFKENSRTTPQLPEDDSEFFKNNENFKEKGDNQDFEINAIFIKEEKLSPGSPELKSEAAIDDPRLKVNVDMNNELPPLDPSKFLELSMVKSEMVFVEELAPISFNEEEDTLMTSDSKEEFPGAKGSLIDSSANQTNSAGIPYLCTTCGKSFSQSSALKAHIMIHTGEKPFKCDICGKAFSQLISLRTHNRIHTGEKPHKCNICDKAFSDYSSLKKHHRIHSGEKPHKCDICGKAFSLSTDLRRHNMIHTKEKPFKCNICDKAFSRSSHLKRHKWTHSGQKI